VTAAPPGFVHRFEPAAVEAGSRRTLLLLHGTGGNEHDLLGLGAALDPAAARLSPRGRVLERGMPRFFRRLAEGVFDLEDLRLRTGELGNFVRAASREYRLDRDQIYAVGFSNGANIAGSLLLTEPGLLRGAVLFRAMVPFEPSRPGGLEGKRVLLSEGRVDPIVPMAQAERLAALFRRAGAEVTLDWRPGGHRLEEADVEAARRWLNPSP